MNEKHKAEIIALLEEASPEHIELVLRFLKRLGTDVKEQEEQI